MTLSIIARFLESSGVSGTLNASKEISRIMNRGFEREGGRTSPYQVWCPDTIGALISNPGTTTAHRYRSEMK